MDEEKANVKPGLRELVQRYGLIAGDDEGNIYFGQDAADFFKRTLKPTNDKEETEDAK